MFSPGRPQDVVLALLVSRQDSKREKGAQGRATLGDGAKTIGSRKFRKCY